MEAVTEFFKGLLAQFDGADFALLAIIDFAAFGAVFIAALFGCIFSRKIRECDKRAYLYVVNAFAAVTLAVFLTEFSPAQSIAVAAVFWLTGFFTYGVLCLFGVRRRTLKKVEELPPSAVGTVSVKPVHRQPLSPQATQPVPAAQTAVRLEHAASIADKLLLKNLGRGDRQELEKIKTALTVLKVKGVLSATDGEALNDMFNALLKLMAKYDL